MKFITYILRRLTRKGEHSAARIISLVAGLAFGILLLSEVFYYYSFDGFYPNADRLYVVYENFKMDASSENLNTNPRVSGAVAPGLKAEVPGVEAATRLNSIGESDFYTSNLKNYKAKFSLADEYVFDVLPRKVISGNPKEILAIPMQCMVSDKIAQAIGGNVVGQTIEMKEYPNKKFVIAGIFEALPENTNYTCDILLSMPSTAQLFSYDGTNNWMGNDRYYACVRLAPGVLPESLMPAVRKMQEKHQDIINMEKIQKGMVFKYSFNPITKIRATEAKDMIIILSAIAFAVLFVSLLNYILLTLNAMVNRVKSSAIYKVCGAQSRSLYKLIFSETAILVVLSLILAAGLILLIRPLAETQLGHSLKTFLNPGIIAPILILVVVIAFLISYLPGRFYSKIPVAAAFHSYRQKRNKWKLLLLSFQFVGASFIFTMMVIVSLQYDKMRKADHGYQAHNVYFGSTSGMNGSSVSALMNKLRSLPDVEKAGFGVSLPISRASGNNIRIPGEERELFNIADFYWIDENYLSILNIPVKEGDTFSAATAPNDLLISKKGADMLQLNTGWKDGVIGKQLKISEHGLTTVRGVYPDFIINSLANADTRPSVFFYMPKERLQKTIDEDPSFSINVVLKSTEASTAKAIKRYTAIFNEFNTHQDAVVLSLEDELVNNYSGERGFKNAMVTGNLVILLITIIGLLGYTANESNRRRKELAIRRINGANFLSILKMFIFDLESIAIPSIAVGLVAAWFTAGKWMMNFVQKIPLHAGLFALCSLGIILLIAVIAAVNYTRIANRNPVESLRYE
ncbi:MAG TPA: ABC transporter permease [Bacteroidales bacterium]|nr:ABC transporter permease [Bacteroidales bacterium]